MITDGLVDEVKKVTEMIRTAETEGYGDRSLNSPLPSMQAIGYKEIARYLYGDITLDETIGLIKKGTKRYAKRQFTWFKKEEGIHWVDITGIDDIYEAFMRVNHILRHLL
jgi:tRNA dimethylallyltransferase